MYIDRKPRIVNRAALPDLARGDRRVHYLHVPKCGGTTLRYILEGYAAMRGLRSANEARRVKGVSPDLSTAEIVMGHERPAEGLTRTDTCYVTVLRDPVRRLRSLVGMIASRHRLAPEAIVEDLSWKQANWAVHLLTGATGPEGRPADRAKEALLSNVHVFGFQEDLINFMALLAATLGVDGVVYPSFQYTPADRRVDHRFDSTFASMASADRELFDFARDLYQKRFAPSIADAEPSRPIPGRTYLCVRVFEARAHVDVSEVRFTE